MKVYDIKEKVLVLTFQERDDANVDNLADLYNYICANTDLEIEQILECTYVGLALDSVLYKIRYI